MENRRPAPGAQVFAGKTAAIAVMVANATIVGAIDNCRTTSARMPP